MSQEPSWDLYRTFGAVLHHGSLSGAARALGLTQPTVARQIDALEATFGTKLFIRTYRGLSPTEAAARLGPHAQTLIQAAAALVRSASPSQQVSGTVRITAGETVGMEYLPPILSSLRRSHPSLNFELSLTDAIEDLSQRKADIAVRMSEPTQKALLARRVRSVEIGLYGHKDYLAERGLPRSWQDLKTHDLVGFDTETPVLRTETEPFQELRRAKFGLRTDSEPAQLAAIRSGFGIGYCQSRVAARAPELVRVMESDLSLSFGMWIAMHSALKTDLACKIVFDALVAGLKEDP